MEQIFFYISTLQQAVRADAKNAQTNNKKNIQDQKQWEDQSIQDSENKGQKNSQRQNQSTATKYS